MMQIRPRAKFKGRPHIHFVFSLALFVFTIIAGAGPVAQANSLPEEGPGIIDRAGLISDQTQQELAATISTSYRHHGNFYQLHFLNSLDNRPIEEYSQQLLDQQLRENPHAVIAVVALEQRQVRIQASPQLSGRLDDTFNSHILGLITPYLSQQNYNMAAKMLTLNILAAMGGEIDISTGNKTTSAPEHSSAISGHIQNWSQMARDSYLDMIIPLTLLIVLILFGGIYPFKRRFYIGEIEHSQQPARHQNSGQKSWNGQGAVPRPGGAGSGR